MQAKQVAVVAAVLFTTLALWACEEKARKSAAPSPAAPSASSTPNAADLYRQAWARIPTTLNTATGVFVLREGEVSIDEPAAAATGVPTSWNGIAALLKANRALIADLLKAAATEHCDWGKPPPPVNGEISMEYVSEAAGKRRTVARIIRADAIRAWKEGDLEGAVVRLKALYAQVGQSPSDPTVIWALTNEGLLMLANDTVRAMCEYAPKLTAAQRRDIRDALGRLDSADPARIAHARAAEGRTDAQTEAALDAGQSKLAADMAETKALLAKGQ